MSVGWASAGFTSVLQPEGASAGSARSTTWEYLLLVERFTE